MLLKPEPAFNLAVLRISVPCVVLLSAELWQAPQWAALPQPLRVVPELLGPFVSLLPQTPAQARVAQSLLVVACIACALGLFSRWSAALLTVAGLRVFALAQQGGAVVHDMHLFWFSALLAASPCGDACSIDRIIASRRAGVALPQPRLGLAYAVPLQSVRALLGVIYFFPGFWKLWTSGLPWIFSDNLRNQMYLKWYQNGFIPALRIDRWPALLHAAALGVVLFELTFIVCALRPRLRWVALCAGLLFHATADLFLHIRFISLWACYSVLIDWDGLRCHWLGWPRALPAARPEPLPAFSLMLAFALLGASITQGARGAMQAWPFACYPTFQWMVGPDIPDLAVEARRPDGTLIALADGPSQGARRSQAAWAMAWRIAGLYGTRASPRQLGAYWSVLCQREGLCEPARGASSLRFSLVHYSAIPEQRGAPARDRTQIAEIPLPGP